MARKSLYAERSKGTRKARFLRHKKGYSAYNRPRIGSSAVINANSSKLTTLIFHPRRGLNLPMPDKLFTTMSYANAGYFAAASAVGTLTQLGCGITNLVLPQNYTGANFTNWPNPTSPVNAANCTALKNLIYNSATNTGFYTNYRIHRVKFKVSVFPETSLDNLNVIMCPLAGTSGFTMGGTSTIANVQDAPYAKYKIINQTDPRGGIMSYNITNRVLRGQTKQQFTDDPGNAGTYSAGPTSSNTMCILFQTQDQGNNASSIGWNVHIEYLVEFFTPIQQFLLD